MQDKPTPSYGRLVHHSARPLAAVHSVTQDERPSYRSPYDKPRGLWVSCVDHENNWHDWCNSETFSLNHFVFDNEIVIVPNANVLVLSGASDLHRFTDEFGVDANISNAWRSVSIDWSNVAKRFSGIIIAPYIWSCRMNEHTNWYYGWDCASGCLWDASVVERIDTRPASTLAAEIAA